MNILIYNLLGKVSKGFGLEIEDRSLKAFQIEKSGRKGCKFVTCGLRNIKKGILQEGDILDQKALAAEITELFKITKPRPIRKKFVVVSVPETKAFIRVITIPKMEREEAHEAIKWETEANIPVAIDSVYLDWQVVNEDDPSTNEILVTAVSRDIIDKYSETMRLADLEIIAIEIDIIATVRSLTSFGELEKEPTMIVDLGEDKTSLAVAKNQVPYFTSSIPICGRTFTDALQKGLGISFEKAEEFKKIYGLGIAQKDEAIHKIMKPLVENLVVEVEKSTRFYEESINTHEKIKRIILAGGGALLEGLVEYVAQRITVEVVLGNPLALIDQKESCPENLQRSLAPYATAIGLAVRACNYDDQNKSSLRKG
jgi:type IV pilus assembly protein PilM